LPNDSRRSIDHLRRWVFARMKEPGELVALRVLAFSALSLYGVPAIPELSFINLGPPELAVRSR
jgi:hypothetical protein